MEEFASHYNRAEFIIVKLLGKNLRVPKEPKTKPISKHSPSTKV